MIRPQSLQNHITVRAGVQASAIFIAFIASVGFNGTSDPQIALFMPLLLLLAGVSLWPGLRAGWRAPKSAAVLLLLLFWLYLAVGTAWSSVPYISHLFTVLIGCLPLVFFAIVMAEDRARSCIAAAGGLALGWLGLAVWVLLQFYVFPDTKGHRISAPMLDPNNMAALLNMGMLAAAACFLAARRRAHMALALGAFAVLSFATMATMSRAGLLMAFGGVALMLALQWRHVAGRPLKALTYALVLPIAYGMIDFGSGNRYLHSFEDLVHTEHSPSVIDRRSLLFSSLRMLKSHPWGDIGLGNFYYFYPAFRGQKDMSDGFFAHIDPLQLTLETGWPAAVLFYAFLAAVLARTVIAWRRLPPDGMARTVMAGSFVALLSLILHSHVNYNLYMPGILIPAAVLLAAWYIASARAPGMDGHYTVTVAPDWRVWASFGMAAFLLAAAQWPLRAGIGSFYIDRANAMIARGDDAAAMDMLDRVAFFGIAGNFSIYEAQGRIMLRRLNGPDVSPERRGDMIREGLSYMQAARRRNPAFSTFMSLEAQFYFLGNGPVFPDGLARAQALLERAVRANPIDIDAREGLAIVYQAQGRSRDALDVLNEGLNWPRPKGQPDINYLMIAARAHEDAGDHEGAKMLADMARERAAGYGLPLAP